MTRLYRRGRLTVLLVTIAFIVCAVLMRHERSFHLAAGITFAALLAAYGLAVRLDECKTIDRIWRRLSKPKGRRLA